MRNRLAAIGGIGVVLLLAAAAAGARTTKEELEELQREVTAAQARKSLAELTYGTPVTGKSGQVADANNLSGIAQQRALALGAATARDLGQAVASSANATPQCSAKSLFVTDDAAVATKLMLATSLDFRLSELQRRIHDLDKDVDAAPGRSTNTKSLALVASSIQGAAGSLVGIWKLFQADYTVGSFDQVNNADWIVANFLAGAACPDATGKTCPYSNRFPATSDTSDLSKRVTDLVKAAEDLKRKAEKTLGKSKDDKDKELVASAGELLKAVTAVQTALLDGGTTGVAPLTTIAPYVRAKKERSCIVRLIDTAPKGLVVTKETIFGKGGRAYLHTSTQLAAIVTDSEGAPRQMLCKQRDLAVVVRMSKLTKEPAPEVAAWKQGLPTASADCLMPSA